ncbi:MAG: hypothetical protein R3E48_23285 [Burkholderiaceae bacterium]
MMFLWYGGGEAADAFNINRSFNIHGHHWRVRLLIGSFFGAAFISSLPTVRNSPVSRLCTAVSEFAEAHDVHRDWRPHHLLPDRELHGLGLTCVDHEAEAARGRSLPAAAAGGHPARAGNENRPTPGRSEEEVG